MGIDLPTEFNYSPSFLRVIIPGIVFTISIIFTPLGIYLYYNNKLLLDDIISFDKLELSVTIISISIVIGIVINSMERPLSRILEGYYHKKILPESIINQMKSNQYDKCIKLIDRFNEPSPRNIERGLLYEELYNNYSIFFYYKSYYESHHIEVSEEEFKSNLMPTTYGNIFRSIEYYPTWKYGMDGVFFWPRLIPNISEQERIDLDYKFAFVNMYTYLCIIFGISFITETLSIFTMREIFAIIFSIATAMVFLIFSILCYKLLLGSAISYGHSVKSAFDLHKKDILKNFDLKLMKIDPNADEKEIYRRIKKYLYSTKKSIFD